MKAMLLGLLFTSVIGITNAAQNPPTEAKASSHRVVPPGKPTELQLQRAGSKKFDLRKLPHTKPKQQERPEFEEPEPNPVELPGGPHVSAPISVPGPSAPAPAPNAVYEGLDRFTWGAGSPPDTNGDVGPTHYIQTVNTSVGVYRKTDGFQEAAFTFNTLMSQGAFGNLCDTDNFGDPVVLYDTFEDRWIITDFAFKLDGGGNVLAPAYQCFAVSMNGDPVTGGWNFYSRLISDNLNDYPKFGIWPDGLYMSANMFSFGAGSAFKGARAWAFNKAQMYAGSATVQVVQFDIGGGDFTVIPSNARLQTGTPPAGSPNLFISTWQFLNALTVYKFHVDWNSIALSTFTGPDTPLAATSWPNAAVGNAGQPGTATLLDVLQIRAMVQNQYTNFGGTESLWVPQTVRRPGVNGLGQPNGTAAPRWYQANVTGGTVAANLVQATTWDPDGASVTNRFMPSLALDRTGNMAMGYSVSSAVNEPLGTSPATSCTTCVNTFPSIMYAGRLAGDPINTFSQTEQTFFTGTASQTGTTRWGDYSAMTLDPDGCTFWYTNEYANPADQTFNHRWLTKFGSFGPFPGCTPVGAGGTVSGTVTLSPGGTPLVGATVMLGSRSATTDGSGNYAFTPIPAGTYPGMTASFPGCTSGAASNIVVSDSSTTTQDFALTAAAGSACLTDTTQSDFLAGVSTNLDLNTSPGDVTLSNAPAVDQANTAGTTTGTSVATTLWEAQSFIPAVTGQLAKVDAQLFCSGCTGTTPNLTLSVRATSGGLPTGADLASATIPGFSSGTGTYYTVTFGSPATLTTGVQYALVLRPVAAPSVGGYFWIRSSPSTYANGQRASSADNGGTWTADSTRDFNFKAYMQSGYAASGDIVSSTKDANPATNSTPLWTTLSWNATTPANTSLQFQAAASNSPGGPFNFVGPDGTAATFFTSSGASLSQFNGKRYLQYRSYLATSNSAVTPTVSDVTACYVDNPPADLSITKDDGVTSVVPGGSLTYTITASNAGPGDATGATVVDTFPAGLTCSSWTCSSPNGGTCTASGAGDISDTVNLPAGSDVIYSASCTLDTGATPGSNLINTATITPLATDVVDPTPGNNSATDQDTVANNVTTTALTSDTNPSVFGQTVTFTATVSVDAPGVGTPTGTVTFNDGGSAIDVEPVVGGVATFATSALAVGDHTISADYSGDSTDDASSGQLTGNPQTVAKADTTTALASDTNPSTFGQSITFTATVSATGPGAGTPTGTVTFLDGATPIGSSPLSGGVATLATSALAAGSHTINASYAGDSDFNGSSGALTGNPQVVNKADTTTSVTSNANPSVFGQSVTFTATIAAVAPGSGTPTGTATFFDGAASIGTGSVSGGVATFTTFALAIGPHTITASYAGSGSFNGSSGPLDTNPQTVNQASTTTTVTSNHNPAALGQAVTFTAKVKPVAPGSGTPGGTVTFFEDATPLASNVTLDAFAQAQLTLSNLSLGSHNISVAYSGSSKYTSSNSTVLVQTISGASLSLSVDDSHLYARYGMVLDYLVTLSNSGNATATNVSVSSAASSGLDVANTNWICVDGGGGATCTASGTGAFADTATLPPSRSLTWQVSVPVFVDATDDTVSLSISAPGAADATDVDTLVIFRSTFDVANADGTDAIWAAPQMVGVLNSNANQVFTLPASRGNAIEDVLALRSGDALTRVQSVTLGTATLVRVLTDVNGQQHASTWARARVGATLVVGNATISSGQHLILLEGAEKSLAAPLGNPAE